LRQFNRNIKKPIRQAIVWWAFWRDIVLRYKL
jgi:hypothetical protein